MKLKCNNCKKMKHDTNFNIKYIFGFPIGLDTKKCQECINPNMYDEVRKFFEKIINK